MSIAPDTTATSPTATPRLSRRGGWIEHWDPEDEEFWETTGRKVARKNLAVSILGEHLGFRPVPAGGGKVMLVSNTARHDNVRRQPRQS